MPTVAVRLEELARNSEGLSPADLKALCQEAALVAMARTSGNGDAPVGVTHADFEEGLRRLREGSPAQAIGRPG
jgi:ATP-dependent 26S proteasome regulatory subunit